MLRRQAHWKDNQNARPELSGTFWGDPGSRSSAHSCPRLPRSHRGARASNETANQGGVEEMLHRQAQWKRHQNARPELPGTSRGDPGSQSSTTSGAATPRLDSASQHARGHEFGFRDRPRTFKAALDANVDGLSSAPCGDASPRRRRFAISGRLRPWPLFLHWCCCWRFGLQ